MEQLKQWFEGLENNEQKIVLAAAAFVSLMLLIFVVLKPLNDKVSSLERQVESRESSVAKWKQAMPKILATRGQASGNRSNQALSSVVTSSTRRFNLKVARVQEKGSDEMQVWFDNIVFNDFVRWSAELQNRYQVKIASVNIRSKDRDGLSSIDVKIRRG
ncbi:type II secretion system protein GspM [Aliikangiella coralliicola]|uniref:Type II secretion system protein M n=1 Tax=Aliikangiella coralliicola TaxID=2592383 RepID=A0A545U7Q1_9GAMM|nr:type II secretion system protein M [Aliikangiella coralliicola]TQV85497.1 type II secretion system protein M [Aliikangiella coralliicola]